MKLLAATFRLTSVLALSFLTAIVAPQASSAQSVSISPNELSFGIPTGSQPRTSTEVITVNITGTGSVTLGSFAISGGQYAGDFAFNGNACATPQTAPATCTIGVQFNSQNPAGVLETATLAFTSSTQSAPITVPLNGAYGAIKLLDSFNINPSLFSYVTWTQNPPTTGQTVQTANVNLSCPANVTATLSSTPDGLSNVFQDNTLQFVNTVGTSITTTTNVCQGGDPNFQGFTGFPAGTTNCFQANYENAAPNYLGQDPDLATFPVNGGGAGSFIANYGVAPINVAALLAPGSGNGTQIQSASFQLQDAGGDLGAGTLHLVTDCTLSGVTPGATVTGNPISTSNPASLTQTYAIDSAPGQDISIVDSDALNPPPSGVVPSVTDIGVPQSLFSQLVTGSSAAPAVCLRMAGELDSLGNPMCKGFFIQCTDTTTGLTSGDNCDPTSPSNARLLYEALQFTSPDAPANGFNFLYGPVGSPAVDACTNALSGVSGAACAQGTGPGILMGSDNWLCAPGQTAPCTPLEPNTSSTGTVYSALNCSLTGSVAGDLCPLDTLTQVKGAADLAGGGTTSGKNSIFIPVVNMPLPSTAVSNSNFQSNGWVQSPASAASLTFTANPAGYAPTSVNPPSNTFVAAPSYAVTYGISAANAPLPDSTYPIAGDVTAFNPTAANPNFGTPLCSSATTPSFSTSPVSISAPGDGIYDLHYFTTDCALTEELVFNPQGSQLTDPTANWASFRYTTFGVDTVAPTFSCNSQNSGVWYNSNQTVSCTVTDQDYVVGTSGSGFQPLVGTIQGSPSENVSVATNVSAGTVNSAAFTNTLKPCDLAGNCVSVSAGPFMIDLQAPTIIGPTLNPGGPYTTTSVVTVTYSCADGAGSGIASCTGVELLSGGSPINVASGGHLNLSAAGNYTFTVTAIDVAGNKSTAVTSFTVTAAKATIIIQLGPTNPVVITKSGSVYSVALTLTNAGNTTASTVKLTGGTLGSSSKPTYPNGNTITNLAPGATATIQINFPTSAGKDGAGVTYKASGTYSGTSKCGGNWSVTVRTVTLP